MFDRGSHKVVDLFQIQTGQVSEGVFPEGKHVARPNRSPLGQDLSENVRRGWPCVTFSIGLLAIYHFAEDTYAGMDGNEVT